ncbi:teichoic acid translocation permease protein TagG [Candidatus Termititenax persephonae]|uniref:Transport permease protein n=1 Tax=Candidatus Termititenax persephonae TaxID=2218525 RepID=A0A388THY8_9BACT|nr:teichoic acid translocation permease protein TagG [Candidatus Termititenax persephonae]
MAGIFRKIKKKVARLGLDPEWDVVIRPRTGWFDINLREVWRYRDLAKLYVYRDFTVTYKQTILGPLWWLIQPLFTSGVYSIIFGGIAGIPTDGVPPLLFYVSGVVFWGYFSSCLSDTSNTFLANSGVFGKVYFPRLVVPLAAVFSDLFKFSIQFVLFLLVYFIFFLRGVPVQPNLCILLLPLLVAHMAVMGMGLGIIASSLTTKYRDLSFFMSYIIQLLMYATPIIYPFSMIPAKWRVIALLNPMVPVMEIFRYAFFGIGNFDARMVVWSICFTLVVIFLGVVVFSRVEKNFMDTI